MVNLLSSGLDWLEQKLNDFCSSPIEYRRGGDSKTVTAMLGKSDYEVGDDYGIRLGGFVWDFLIEAEALGFEPQVGDLIVVNSRSFEVMNLADQNCWRWTGPNCKTYRIHTKEI